MKSLFQFLSAPVAAIALTLILAVAGGIESGTVPFPVALVATVLLAGIEIVAIRAMVSRESEDDSL